MTNANDDDEPTGLERVNQRHDGEDTPRAERCCDQMDLEVTWGMGNGENNIITVWCSTCGHDFMSIWPKGSLEEDGWPKDWTRPPSMLTTPDLEAEWERQDRIENPFGPPDRTVPKGETDEQWLENRGLDV